MSGMNRTLRCIVLAAAGAGLALLGGCAASGSASARSFGEPLQLSAAEARSVGQVVGDADALAGQHIRVNGVVTDVCQSMGCWMKVADDAGGEPLFVKFTCPSEGRLIPTDAVGKLAIVEGELKVKTISVDEARHYAEESGADAAKVAAITEPQRQITLAAPSAIVLGID